MRIEIIFFAGFIGALFIGFVMQPYLSSQKDGSLQKEVEFENFLLTQVDENGFKGIIKGKSAQKYDQLLLLQEPFAYDKSGATAKGENAKLINDNLYLQRDVIITTPQGVKLYSQNVLYHTKEQMFESLTPFVALYNEHQFEGKKLRYQDGVIKSKNIKAYIKQDDQ